MTIKPIVRHMLLCNAWKLDGPNKRRLTIEGLISNIHATDDPPYPLLYEQFYVFLLLTECRNHGYGKVYCLHEESGFVVHETQPQLIKFGNDPLAVLGVSFQIQDCNFAYPGRYVVQFLYDDDLLHECQLNLR